VVNDIIFLWLNGLVGQSVVLDAVALFGARDLIYIMGAVFVGLLMKAKPIRRPQILIASVLCLVVGLQLVVLIHRLHPNPRPQATDIPVVALIDYADNYSFPSRHTLIAFLLAVLVFSLRPSFGIAFLAGATIIGLARVVVGVHWPLDVLGGALIGLSIGYLGHLLLYE